MKAVTTVKQVSCENEYSTLREILVVKPTFMRIAEVINETQKHYVESNINVHRALKQHDAFVSVLEEHNVAVRELEADPKLNEQVFTRDIGFVVGNEFFISSMNEQIRQNETNYLDAWLKQNSVPSQTELPHSIEWGSSVCDGSTIWVGNSRRTSNKAIKELQNRLPHYQVESIVVKPDILHLDCVLNILSHDTAIVYRPAFTSNGLERLEARFKHIIEVAEDEQFEMGPNVLSIGNEKVISLPQNKLLNKRMTEEGFQVITIPFSEIIKSGGSFRCCTLPLVRDV
ncbi:hypothetical protein E3U55_08760 [Filobacillus milosensis]|uniref:Amidinotransferase n=1 Tax=Filobacillus milosensis TaxID=94137 RepID=A0A4Y8IMU5_9BACI|nr:arginine deiminase family protein [Filobacillus milosensis]TFB21395.1 hypothetical protein E3U55_08760 [Filobacillus milosensis]